MRVAGRACPRLRSCRGRSAAPACAVVHRDRVAVVGGRCGVPALPPQPASRPSRTTAPRHERSRRLVHGEALSWAGGCSPVDAPSSACSAIACLGAVAARSEQVEIGAERVAANGQIGRPVQQAARARPFRRQRGRVQLADVGAQRRALAIQRGQVGLQAAARRCERSARARRSRP